MKKNKKDRRPRERKGPSLGQRMTQWFTSWKASGYEGLRLYITLVVIFGAVIGVVAGLRALERRVLAGQVGKLPQAVALTCDDNATDWMPEELGQQIREDLLPEGSRYNDDSLARAVCERAQANPWIAQVQDVTKRLGPDPRIGEVVLKAEYRQPAARVQISDHTWLYVDAQGYRLPDEVPTFRGQVRLGNRVVERWYFAATAPAGAEPIHYIDIIGVSTPPPAIGQKWEADELADGLRLAGLLRRYTWQNQVATIDVRNYEGKLDPNGPWLQIVAKAQTGNMNVAFGHFPMPHGDWEISTEDKLSGLDSFVRKHNGPVKGTIDLRPANPRVRFD